MSLLHLRGPPVLPPVPELSYDIFDGINFEFEAMVTPPLSSSPSLNPPSPPLHSPIPVKLMDSNLVPRPPPSSAADVPDDFSDAEEDIGDMVENDRGTVLASALPEYLTPSPTRHTFALSDDNVVDFKPTPPLHIRKRTPPNGRDNIRKRTPPNGLQLFPDRHRDTLPDCPRTPTPSRRFVEVIHPDLFAIVNGELKEGGLPYGLLSDVIPAAIVGTKEPGGDGSSTEPDSITVSPTKNNIPLADDPAVRAPFTHAPSAQCKCQLSPPPFALQPLPPLPPTSSAIKIKTIPSSEPTHRRRASDEPKPSPVAPTIRPSSMQADDSRHPAATCRHPPAPPPIQEAYTIERPSIRSPRPDWNAMPPQPLRRPSIDQFGIALPYTPHRPTHQPPLRPTHPPPLAHTHQQMYHGPPVRPPRPEQGLNVDDIESLEDRKPTHLVHLQNKANRQGGASSSHSRRPSDPEASSSFGSIKEAFTESIKSAFAESTKTRTESTKYNHGGLVWAKRRDPEDTRKSMVSPAPSELDNYSVFDLGLPPPTTNAKAVSLLGHHDRRHDRRGSEASEALMAPDPPRPFPGATSKAAALLGIGAPEPTPTPVTKRFVKKFSSPSRGTNTSAFPFARRRTEPTGWSGAGATIKTTSQYALQMVLDDELSLDEDDEDDYEDGILDLSPTPPLPVSRTPTLEEAVVIAPSRGQTFSPVSARLSIHGSSDRAHSPMGTMAHPFANKTNAPHVRPDTAASGHSVSLSERTMHSQMSMQSSQISVHSSHSYSEHFNAKALQHRSTLKARPPPISVQRVSPTRDYPMVVQGEASMPSPTIDNLTPRPNLAAESATVTPRNWDLAPEDQMTLTSVRDRIPNDSTLMPTPQPNLDAKEEAPRLRTHILAKYRLIDPPIAASIVGSEGTDSNRTSTYTTTSGTGSTSTGTYTESSSDNTRSSYSGTTTGSVTNRNSYATTHESEWSGPQHRALQESSGHLAPSQSHSRPHSRGPSPASSRGSGSTYDSRHPPASHADFDPRPALGVLSERLKRGHMRNTSTATVQSTASTAMSTLSTSNSLRSVAGKLGRMGWLGQGTIVPENDLKRALQAHTNTQAHPALASLTIPEGLPRGPTPWHNYNIRYDKDGREIPNLTPRSAPSFGGTTLVGSSASSFAGMSGIGGGLGTGRDADMSWFEPPTPARVSHRASTGLRLGAWKKASPKSRG